MPPPAFPPSARGFTLVELMVVVAILGAALLFVPPNLGRFGARSRLENSANTLVSLVAAAREQAILDGRPVRLELGLHKDAEGEVRHGHRLILSSRPVETQAEFQEDEDGEIDDRPETDEEWIETVWHDLASGVVYYGVSEERDQWQKLVQDRPYSVEFGPDGSVEKGFAVRLVSEDLEEGGVKEEYRTFTVIVNPLTAESTAEEGTAEMPPQLDENDFSR